MRRTSAIWTRPKLLCGYGSMFWDIFPLHLSTLSELTNILKGLVVLITTVGGVRGLEELGVSEFGQRSHSHPQGQNYLH